MSIDNTWVKLGQSPLNYTIKVCKVYHLECLNYNYIYISCDMITWDSLVWWTKIKWSCSMFHYIGPDLYVGGHWNDLIQCNVHVFK